MMGSVLVLPRRFGTFSLLWFVRIGLEVNLDKTEVIPACSSSQSFSPGDFQGCVWVGSSDFKLLVAPLGPQVGVRICLVGASARPGSSWQLSASSRTLRALSVCSALAPGGPRSSILSVLFLPMSI